METGKLKIVLAESKLYSYVFMKDPRFEKSENNEGWTRIFDYHVNRKTDLKLKHFELLF